MAPAVANVISLLVFSAVHSCASILNRSPFGLSLHLSCAVHLPKCSYHYANSVQGDKSFERFDLQYNMLPTINPQAFDRVQELNISGNAPPASFDFFRHLPMLAILDMSRMNLSFTPATSNIFADLTQLTELDLSGNKIQLTNTTFTGLERLRSLNLASNNISVLPMGCFAGLLSLDSLNLRHNRISKLDFGTFTIHGMKRFGVLDLSYNRFVDFVDLRTLATLGSLNTLLLHGNGLWMNDRQVLRLLKLKNLGIQHTKVKCRHLIDLVAADFGLIADHGDYVYNQRNMYGIRCQL